MQIRYLDSKTNKILRRSIVGPEAYFNGYKQKIIEIEKKIKIE